MGDKSEICVYCGRFTTLKAADGLAECDRPDCIATRLDEILEGERVEATDERGNRRIGKVVRLGDLKVDNKWIEVMDILWEDDETLSLNLPVDGAERVDGD